MHLQTGTLRVHCADQQARASLCSPLQSVPTNSHSSGQTAVLAETVRGTSDPEAATFLLIKMAKKGLYTCSWLPKAEECSTKKGTLYIRNNRLWVHQHDQPLLSSANQASSGHKVSSEPRYLHPLYPAL